jgi:hypothetical protein
VSVDSDYSRAAATPTADFNLLVATRRLLRNNLDGVTEPGVAGSIR